ncbi:MAG: hypothetical protein ABJF10_04860 [Chthoniobacter sp.]|uniref:hypothetical protein n=1 Tax=Chthoniobacter sp. TaxID=2510640 RepID=UPI0032A54C34
MLIFLRRLFAAGLDRQIEQALPPESPTRGQLRVPCGETEQTPHWTWESYHDSASGATARLRFALPLSGSPHVARDAPQDRRRPAGMRR